jgi:4-amino-4-deoxychorismate lyase
MDLFFANGVLIENHKTGSQISAQVSFNDRALQYGDGVFETVRIFNGEIPMWEFHQQRLGNAQKILGLALDDFFAQWPSFVEKNLAGIEHACAKLVISRGEGPRGYKIPDKAQINWWLKLTDLPASGLAKTPPFRLTLCQHAISRQPALAGLKHLNRLDQVMARSEWSEQDAFDEGIMFNLDGDVIEGTMSNIFWLEGEQLYTTDLSQEGIDGCVRRWLIKQQKNKRPIIIEKNVKLDRLLNADGVFLSNSLIGIQSVAEIDGQIIAQSYQIDELTSQFNRQYV